MIGTTEKSELANAKKSSAASTITQQWLRILDSVAKDERSLREKVARDRQILSEQGVPGEKIRTQLTRRYVDSAIIRSTSVNAASAIPFSLPLVGLVPTFALTLAGSILYTYKNELELGYLLAHANETELTDDKLKYCVFWLVRLTDFNSIKNQAAGMGVNMTLKSFVEKLVVNSLSRGLGHVCAATGLFSLAVVQSGTAKWVSLVVGSPLAGFYGYRSTKGVARRAVEYFYQSN